MVAPSASVSVWFRLEGGAPDKVRIEATSDVADLRDAIYAKVKAELEPRGITARLLVLSTADGKTYDDPRALVSTLPLDKEFIVTGTFVRAARSPFAAVAYGPRSSSGHAWKRSCRSGYWPAGGMFVCAWRRGFRRRLAVFVSGRAGRIMCGKCRSEFPPDFYENHRCPECKRLCACVLVSLSVFSRSVKTSSPGRPVCVVYCVFLFVVWCWPRRLCASMSPRSLCSTGCPVWHCSVLVLFLLS